MHQANNLSSRAIKEYWQTVRSFNYEGCIFFIRYKTVSGENLAALIRENYPISMDLVKVEKIFIGIRTPIIEPGDIGELAKKIFDDVNFDFYKHQEEGNVILFRPNGIDDYSQNYMGHYVSVKDPLRYPIMTISTGNRGSIKLHLRQRGKYFQFVKELYELFLEKANT